MDDREYGQLVEGTLTERKHSADLKFKQEVLTVEIKGIAPLIINRVSGGCGGHHH
jgi:frataxin-like iron-binding protein CyaY